MNDETTPASYVLSEVRSILSDALQLGDRGSALNVDSPLLGSLPELDSMAVVTVITAIEEHYGFIVDDDDISAETFSTLGNLVAIIADKANV